LLKLGLRPESCLAIEDTYNGLRAARGAGITTIITTNAYTAHEDFPGAAVVVNHLGEPGLPCDVRGDLELRLLDLPVLRGIHAQLPCSTSSERRQLQRVHA
jgi:beta-phosphoglucomutase-like phosphatase (HAD superfamily)